MIGGKLGAQYVTKFKEWRLEILSTNDFFELNEKILELKKLVDNHMEEWTALQEDEEI